MNYEEEIAELREIALEKIGATNLKPAVLSKNAIMDIIDGFTSDAKMAQRFLKIIEAQQKEIEILHDLGKANALVVEELCRKNAQLKKKLEKYEPYPEGYANQAKTSFLEQLNKI